MAHSMNSSLEGEEFDSKEFNELLVGEVYKLTQKAVDEVKGDLTTAALDNVLRGPKMKNQIKELMVKYRYSGKVDDHLIRVVALQVQTQSEI